VALALGFWLASDRSQNVEPGLEPTPSNVAARAVSAPDDAAAATQSEQPTLPADEPASPQLAAETADPRIDTLYRDPGFRAALMTYLVDSGLSAPDSERVVDSAVDGLSECASSPGYDARNLGRAVCDQNVLQRAGLDEAVLQVAISQGGRSVARRRALEGPRGWEIGAALSFQERTSSASREPTNSPGGRSSEGSR
jgi:hypothetical protein